MTRTVSAAPIRAITLLTAARALRAARGRQRPESPAELARRLIPGYVVTPAIKLLSDELVRAVEEPDSRLIVTMPPRTGKSVLTSQVFPVWLLSRGEDRTRPTLSSCSCSIGVAAWRKAAVRRCWRFSSVRTGRTGS